MIPLLLFLLAVAAVYLGTIETAFSALMRLSLRLMAERGGRNDRLGYYLDDPIQLFVPARLLLGIIFSLATVVLAVLTGRSGVSLTSVATLLACRRGLHPGVRALPAVADRAEEPRGGAGGAAAAFQRDRACDVAVLTGGFVRLSTGGRRASVAPPAIQDEDRTGGSSARVP